LARSRSSRLPLPCPHRSVFFLFFLSYYFFVFREAQALSHFRASSAAASRENRFPPSLPPSFLSEVFSPPLEPVMNSKGIFRWEIEMLPSLFFLFLRPSYFSTLMRRRPPSLLLGLAKPCLFVSSIYPDSVPPHELLSTSVWRS